jgi:hypothetical protein
MNDIGQGNFLPKSNLSQMGQQLYDCVSGKNFVLDDEDFPDFSKAIEYSIANENGWCYKRLQSKSTEFNKDKPSLALKKITIKMHLFETKCFLYSSIQPYETIFNPFTLCTA